MIKIVQVKLPGGGEKEFYMRDEAGKAIPRGNIGRILIETVQSS